MNPFYQAYTHFSYSGPFNLKFSQETHRNKQKQKGCPNMPSWGYPAYHSFFRIEVTRKKTIQVYRNTKLK